MEPCRALAFGYALFPHILLLQADTDQLARRVGGRHVACHFRHGFEKVVVGFLDFAPQLPHLFRDLAAHLDDVEFALARQLACDKKVVALVVGNTQVIDQHVTRSGSNALALPGS